MSGRRRFVLACALLAGALLALGLHLPFMRVGEPLLSAYGPEEHSLISAVNILVRSNQVLLGSLLLMLSILLPLLKLLYVLLLAVLPLTEINRSAAPLGALAWLGRWSPSDLVALALTAALVASQETLAQRVAAGAYCFAAAVPAMVLACMWLRRDAASTRPPAPAAHAPRGPLFAALVAVAVLTFALGVTLPVVQLGSARAHPSSVADIVLALHARGETTPWVALLTLGIVLPGFRLLYLLTVAAARALPPAVRGKAIVGAGLLGRHATADSMVLSLMLFYLMVTRQADAALQPGVYCLAASAGLTLIAYAWANLPVAAASTRPSSLAARLAGLDSVGKL